MAISPLGPKPNLEVWIFGSFGFLALGMTAQRCEARQGRKEELNAISLALLNIYIYIYLDEYGGEWI